MSSPMTKEMADCWQEHRCDICGTSWEDERLRALGAITPPQIVAREIGSGVPMLPWECRSYFEEYAEYEGHAFVTCDPKHLGRSVCDGFIDDMQWITDLHNRVIDDGWRARLARRLLGLTIREGQ